VADQPIVAAGNAFCGALRMAQKAAHMVDPFIPRVPVSQWAQSLSIPLRLQLTARAKPVTLVLQVVHLVLTDFLDRQAGQPDCGAVTLIQRFGGEVLGCHG
jgi:hypothetical protein